MNKQNGQSEGPLESLDEWDDFVAERYPENGKARNDYRAFDTPARETVREFYRMNHQFQTWDFVHQCRNKYLSLSKRQMSVFEALEFLNTLVDDSDPDIELSQLDHLLQSSEAIRADGHEDWFVLVGLIHDLGKVLCLFGEPQWAVVGDTFPVGCAYREEVVYHEFFTNNPDFNNRRFQTPTGVYNQGCGLGNVQMSWGHDEYLYHVMKPYLPEPALYMIRYHSFYAWHKEGAYDELADDHDREMLPWVRKFNPYDLYSKSQVAPDWKSLRPYYESLVNKYLPPTIAW